MIKKSEEHDKKLIFLCRVSDEDKGRPKVFAIFPEKAQSFPLWDGEEDGTRNTQKIIMTK